MAIAHDGYLVLKMPSLVGILTVQGDRTAALAVEKLHTLAAEITQLDDGGRGPSTKAPSKAPKVQPTRADCGPAKPSRSVRTPPRPPASQGIWEKNRNSRSSPSSKQMPTSSLGSRRRCLGSPGR
jgi:hypothetical protein